MNYEAKVHRIELATTIAGQKIRLICDIKIQYKNEQRQKYGYI